MDECKPLPMMACVMRLMRYAVSTSVIASSSPTDDVLGSSAPPSSCASSSPQSAPGAGCDSSRAVVAAC